MFHRRWFSQHFGNRRRSARKHSVQSRFEPLERRECLTVTVLDLGHTLKIAGDADNDRIEIVDHGGGALTVNGAEYSGIRKLSVNTKGGADEVLYETEGEISLSEIRIQMGAGDDIADLNLGAVAGRLRSEIDGGIGDDQIRAAIDAVLADGDAANLLDGGLGDDVLRCVLNDVAGRASCHSRGDLGDDQIFCEKNNVLAGGQAECISDGGLGDDSIQCMAVDIAGHSACIGKGGLGDDIVSCSIANMTESGSALCDQSGGAGDDVITCDKASIRGMHVCFGDGGSGNDVMNWIVRGENSGDFQCTMDGGRGDDVMNILVGNATEAVSFTGTVDYSADTGRGDDVWNSVVNFTPDSDGVFSNFTVLLGKGNDMAVLGFIGLGATQVQSGLFTGGAGEDTYLGPPPVFLSFPVDDFEIGV